MAKVDLIMPKMGESIMEATILKWLKQEGERVEMDETILEIATDKVDSEIPSPVDGVISKILFPENETISIGTVIAEIQTEGEDQEVQASPAVAESPAPKTEQVADVPASAAAITSVAPTDEKSLRPGKLGAATRFYSPLVRNIAASEGVSLMELEQIQGSGMSGRVTKNDILAYIQNRKTSPAPVSQAAAPSVKSVLQSPSTQYQEAANVTPVQAGPNEEIIEMDRMRKMIAHHMVESKRTSPHVTSFVEADVTHLVNWRNKNKNSFQSSYGEKLTFTPIFIEAICKAIRDFPMVNISVNGDQIIKKNYINIGMATALPSGNLIVPVIKNADRLNLAGLAAEVNGLALKARNNQLKPEEIQGATFTITNVGTFGNLMGTPIIPQPQVAILATGAIKKKPAVIETEFGDLIAVRQMMFLSLSYDHRVVDGALGGAFLRKIADYLEAFDPNRQI